ncbi:E3 ubiquitin-protein ligase znrf2 isoform X2 [Brachyhypopomus gauderio]|uniref:E3 ubiquitin-protein ligase znrf2 isoform X2 n=1 Tax=Brachyhypopomus gauderio TaxID=698409 RepID=UPI004042EADA
MGAKQSSPPSGRTRAYSGSALPSNTSTSNGNGRSASVALRYNPGTGAAAHGAAGALPSSSHHTGPRSRAVGGSGSGSGPRPHSGISIPSTGVHSSQESGSSTPDDTAVETGRAAGGPGAPRLVIGSLPSHLSPHLFGGFKCPVCSKFISSDEMDLHLVMCLTKPRVTYNGTNIQCCAIAPSSYSTLLEARLHNKIHLRTVTQSNATV